MVCVWGGEDGLKVGVHGHKAESGAFAFRQRGMAMNLLVV